MTAMNTRLRHIATAAVSAFLLMAVSACTGLQTVPDMGEYSYVPKAKTISVLTPEGIESF
jgi:hypothetical protein